MSDVRQVTVAAGFAMVSLLLPPTLAMMMWRHVAKSGDGYMRLPFAAAVLVAYLVGAVLTHQLALLPYVRMMVAIPSMPGLEGMPIATTVNLTEYIRFSSRLLMTGGMLLALPAFAITARLSSMMTVRAHHCRDALRDRHRRPWLASEPSPASSASSITRWASRSRSSSASASRACYRPRRAARHNIPRHSNALLRFLFWQRA